METEHDRRPYIQPESPRVCGRSEVAEQHSPAVHEVAAVQGFSPAQLAVLVQRAPLTIPVEPVVIAIDGRLERSQPAPEMTQLCQWRAFAGFRIALRYGHIPDATDVEQQQHA